MPTDYKGEIIETMLQKSSDKYNTIFRIFTIDKNGSYEYDSKIVPSDSEDRELKISNVLLLSSDDSGDGVPGAPEQHLMFIKDVEDLTKCHIYPKCHAYCLSACNNGNYRKDLFDKHISKCTGEVKQNLCLLRLLIQIL
jgi:hypothetical protein